MADEIGTKVSQLPLGENLADSDLMYAVEGGISKKVEVGYLKNRLVGNVDSAPTQGSTNLVQSGGVYTALASKADSSDIPTDLADLADDSTHRTVTDAEKAAWDGKADTSDIPTALSDLTDDSTHRVVSDTEKATWNGKSDFSGSYNDLTDKPTIPTVEANPSGEATDELDKIKIGTTIYDIVGGGGGSEPIYGEASGSVANFADGSDNPLSDIKIAINAIQSGSGTPSPSNPMPISGWTGANVNNTPSINLLPPTIPSNIIAGTLNSSGAIASASNARVVAIPVPQNANLCIQKDETDTLGGALGLGDTGNIAVGTPVYSYTGFTNVQTVTLNSGNHTWLYINAATLTNTEGYWSDRKLMISAGTSRKTYVAPSAYATYPISWQTEAGTVYAGTLDVTNGTLKARPYYASYNGETLVGPWISSLDEYEEGATPTTGAQVVDLGGTETTYQLTPTQVSSILGVNNVWADCGDINYLKYQRDLNACINDIIRRIEALENA